MKELIEVSNRTVGSQAIQSVLAKDLYLGLGLASAHWAKWAGVNIEQNEFFAEHKDWAGFTQRVNGNETREFAVSIDFAKHIAMMAKTERAHEYRNYFLECERKTKQSPLTQLEMLAQAVLAQVEQERRLVATEQQVSAIAMKIETLEVDLRNGVPQGFVSKSNAHKQYGKGLSRAIFDAVMLQYDVTTQKYVHSENGHSTSTFAYNESEISDVVEDFISGSEQITPAMCYSKLLNKRFGFIKGV